MEGFTLCPDGDIKIYPSNGTQTQQGIIIELQYDGERTNEEIEEFLFNNILFFSTIEQ